MKISNKTKFAIKKMISEAWEASEKKEYLLKEKERIENELKNMDEVVSGDNNEPIFQIKGTHLVEDGVEGINQSDDVDNKTTSPEDTLELTLDSVGRALRGKDFWLHPDGEDAKIIEKAEKLGYVLRLSHTQAQWTEHGINSLKNLDESWTEIDEEWEKLEEEWGEPDLGSGEDPHYYEEEDDVEVELGEPMPKIQRDLSGKMSPEEISEVIAMVNEENKKESALNESINRWKKLGGII